MNDITSEKKTVRTAALESRAHIKDDERSFWNQLIFERAHKIRAFQLAKRIHVYRDIRGEVATMPFIEYAWATGKEVYVPVVAADVMRHVRVTHATRWAPGGFGIHEPVPDEHGDTTDDDGFTTNDVVIVPLAAFDASCNRVGYGRGFYDRFLSATDAVSIGLAYECQKVAKVPADIHDVPLRCVVTERQVYVRD